jgi:ELWxxDGT repeat protein
LCFVASYNQLWKLGGTEIGIDFVENIFNPSYILGNRQVSVHSIITSTDKIFFSNYDVINGYELWVSNGSVFSTYLVCDLRTGNKNTVTGGNFGLQNQ